MKVSERGAAFIAAHEGWVARWYRDPVGVPTIGHGFTWRSAAFREWWKENRPGQTFGPGATLTRQEGLIILRRLLDREYGSAVNTFLGQRTVPQHVFDAMTSMVFNCGAGSLKWNWAKAVLRGDYTTAADLLKTTAITAKGVRLPGLERRRKEEAALLLHGDYHGAKVPAERPAAAPSVLSFGSKGGPVTALQDDLKKLRLYDGVVDGRFGRGTQAAVMALQSLAGLRVDGIVGPATRAEIAAFLGKAAAPKTPQKPADAQKPAPAAKSWLGVLVEALARMFKR